MNEEFRIRSSQSGFTLLELSVAIVVMVTVVGSVFGALDFIARGGARVTGNFLALEKVRAANADVARALWGLNALDTDTLGAPLCEVLNSGTKLSFRTPEVVVDNVTGDVTEGFSNPVEYEVQGGNFVRVQNGVTEIVVPDVVSSSFAVSVDGVIRMALTIEDGGVDTTFDLAFVARG